MAYRLLISLAKILFASLVVGVALSSLDITPEQILRDFGMTPDQAVGASRFHHQLLPPDLITYSFYRFECALRASAVLGFVGIETIGLSIQLSHEEFYYREVWTYFYLLLAMIVIVDLWGAAIRKRLHPA